MSSQWHVVNVEPTRVSQPVFTAIIWSFYAIAIIMAMVRTGFRVHTFRKFDIDDGFLILASLCLTGLNVILHTLYPYMLDQNKVSLGQLIPGPDFAAEMLLAKKLETAGSHLYWFGVFSVKFCYLFFFKRLLERTRNFMIWWWIVVALTTTCAVIAICFDWTICPHFGLDFLEICPVSEITAREHIWLIVTTVTDIVSDAFIISIPVMILWNVRIPLRAKFGIGAALSLSLCMMVIAIIRISLGALAPQVTDTVWTYFTFSLEASTAVFMVSATAFRSTFGYHKSHKTGKTAGTKDTPLSNISRKGEQLAHGRPLIDPPRARAMEWYEKEDMYTKTIYQPEVDERTEDTRSLV